HHFASQLSKHIDAGQSDTTQLHRNPHLTRRTCHLFASPAPAEHAARRGSPSSDNFAGSVSPAKIAPTHAELADALHGRIRSHHRFLIGQHVKTIEQLEETIAAFDARIEAALEPFRDALERLKEVPGLSETSAQILIAEIGTDMSQFPTAGHLLSWAGLIPRLDESAGKLRSTRVRKSAPWLKPVLVQCAWAAARKKNSYFEAQFLRLKARCGPKKAVVAVAASILTTTYHMLADGTCYQDVGADHFVRRNPARAAAKLASRIRNLGFHVEIRPAA
ncbi:MAG: transposase, partial [Hyphomicrobiaceae bacterium]